LDAAPNGINAWLADTIQDVVKGKANVVARNVLKSLKNPPTDFAGCGYGLQVTLDRALSAEDILSGFGARVFDSPYLNVAAPRGCDLGSASVGSIGVCAGSGGSILKDSDADMYITGEMSHHEALRAIQLGKIVATTFHSNSERAFLGKRMRGLLEERLREWEPSAEVLVSEADQDPFRTITTSKS
jgi:putative NIF3 family GTP cyclohydrolase 1 type 2